MKVTIDLCGGHVIEGTAEEIKEYFELMGMDFTLEVKEEERPSFKVGDTVKALANGQLRNIYVGDVGMITDCNNDNDGDPYSIRVVKENGVDDYFRLQDLELVYRPTEGDIVVITGNTNWSRNKVGDIGKVGRVKVGIAKVDVPNRPSKAGEYGNWTKFNEMRPATDEEKAHYEQALKWAKFGRKPGEFKMGDIVRVVVDSSYGHPKGTIGEVVKDTEYCEPLVKALYKDGRTLELSSYSELITPVEMRVDR